jgi:Zn-dependent peptidase ImmA (M78 family)
MAMTKVEKASKQWIVNKLAKEGYATYSRILQNFDFNLTDDPNTIGYMIPNKGVIVINKKLDEDQVSVICRHEILHSYLNHEKRLITHLAK